MSTVIELIYEQMSAAKGVIPFAKFMELALYAPGKGYYERGVKQVGRTGDFYTSVSVGPFFGELLAFQFARWLDPLAKEGPVQIVEAGAHDGRFALDVLAGLQKHAPALLAHLEYWIVEPSPARRPAHEITLAGKSNVRWRSSVPGPKGVRGVIFSNELLDAMPVHPFAWNAEGRRWEEIGVTAGDSGLHLTRMPKPTTPAPQLPAALLDVLPNGYVVESCPAALAWWSKAARSLSKGVLMTIDYGGTVEELLNPSRTSGTVRAYSKHGLAPDPLASPGEQDITAHVDFTAIRAAGEAAGLRTTRFTTQSQFLTEIARELWSQTGSWPQECVRQFQTLTHPEHLGRPFRVLVQEKR